MNSISFNHAKYPASINLLILFCLFGLATICEAQSTWTTKQDMPTARLWLSCEVVDGKIYAIGGVTQFGGSAVATVEEYDPQTDTWDTTKTPMPTARCWMASAVYDNKIYIIGGNPNYSYQGTNHVRKVEVYDPATDTWDTNKAKALTARSGASTCVVNGIIYVMGGGTWGGVSILTL
jgi:N-acetylneuraminic acid mutarotase